MKMLIGTVAAVTFSLSLGAWQLIQPHLIAGTSVITQKPTDNKAGGKPYTVLVPAHLTKAQLALLEFAYDVAVKDGHKHPELVQGILMQETKAGAMPGSPWRVAGMGNKPDDRYYGVGQVKLAAAQDVMKAYPELWRYCNTKTDDELKARLITDDEFNVRVTSKYALLMGINKDPSFGVTAYNKGQGGAQLVDVSTDDYTNKVKQHAARLKVVTASR